MKCGGEKMLANLSLLILRMQLESIHVTLVSLLISKSRAKNYLFNRELDVIPDLVMSGALQHIDHLHVDWTRWGLMHDQFSFLQDAAQSLTHSCCNIHQIWHFSPQGWLDKHHFGWTTLWSNEHPQHNWQRAWTFAHNGGNFPKLFDRSPVLKLSFV